MFLFAHSFHETLERWLTPNQVEPHTLALRVSRCHALTRRQFLINNNNKQQLKQQQQQQLGDSVRSLVRSVSGDISCCLPLHAHVCSHNKWIIDISQAIFTNMLVHTGPQWRYGQLSTHCLHIQWFYYAPCHCPAPPRVIFICCTTTNMSICKLSVDIPVGKALTHRTLFTSLCLLLFHRFSLYHANHSPIAGSFVVFVIQ